MDILSVGWCFWPGAVIRRILGVTVATLSRHAELWLAYILPAMILLLAVLTPIALRMAEQWEKAVVLRFGKLHSIREPGLFLIVPFVDRVSHWIDQRIQVTTFNAEQALTKDTVPANVDAVLFWQVHNAERGALEIIDYRDAILCVAQTSLWEMIGSPYSSLPQWEWPACSADGRFSR